MNGPAGRFNRYGRLHYPQSGFAFWAVLLLIAVPLNASAQGAPAANTPEANLHAERAQAAIRANQPEVAVAELQELLRLKPQDANTWASLGMVQFTRGQYKEAASDFEAALRRSATSWNARAFLGMCEVRLGELNKGQAQIEDALEHVKDRTLHRQAGLELVNSYLNSGLTDRAALRIEGLQREDPDNPDLLYAAYRIHSALASAALQKLAKTSPESARVHQVLGDAMLAQENYRRAVDEYRDALSRNPRLAGAHLGMGQALLAEDRDGNLAAAQNEFQAELAIDGDNPDALFQLGQIASERGDPGRAADLFHASLAARPHFADAHIALAKIFADRNEDATAIEHLESALAAAPDNKTAHYRLAQLYKKSGQLTKADEQFEIARKLQTSENRASPLGTGSGSKP